MLQYLNQCSRGRGAWLLMALTAFVLELVALWFQHVMLLQPCVMCIYERCALFGIMGAGPGGRYRPQNAAALCRHGNLVVQRDTRTTAGVGAYDDPAAPFTVPDLRFRAPLPQPGCRWINGCRRFFVASGELFSYVSGSSCRWEMPPMAGGDFRRLSAGRYSGDRCSAFQSEKTRSVWSLSRGEYSPQ